MTNALNNLSLVIFASQLFRGQNDDFTFLDTILKLLEKLFNV
ncbi:hypothetical protein N824_07850 [Pedobacter sp. V48]|nr:hypothetical protein N824_07850 [Pedobacter sp. V48]